LRTNTQIRAPRVRLVGDGAPEDLDLRTALLRAREADLDLVEMNPAATPPIVKIMNYGRYKYEQEKREREAKRGQKTVELKEIRFSPKIDTGDLAVRIRQTVKFIGEGHRVRVSVRFRGREQSHPEIARGLLAQVVEAVSAAGGVALGTPLMEGRFLFVVVVPAKMAAKPAPKPEA
jgi:translation initiation factor IF-3